MVLASNAGRTGTKPTLVGAVFAFPDLCDTKEPFKLKFTMI